MAEALRLAERGLYTAHPNPRVGSVIVKDGNIIGRGFHLRTGEGHAEARALVEAGVNARGATVYCTLEPCSFHGRTPSCARALIDAGVSRVVVAMADPDPRNAGKGLAMLREAGIDVVHPLMESSARLLNPGHVKRYEVGLPFVRLKLAMTMDGKTALGNGESRWITGPAARRDVQRLRARSSAIVTGVQTVVDDDPALSVRPDELDVEYAGLSAALGRPVVILDPTLRTPAGARLMASPGTMVVCVEGADVEAFGGKALALPSDGQGRVDLDALLRHLAGMACNEVLFECGATLAGSLVRAGLADEIVIYIAAAALGADARSLLNFAKIDTMADRIEFKTTDVRYVGEDLRVTCVPGTK